MSITKKEKRKDVVLYIENCPTDQQLMKKILERRPNIELFCASLAQTGIEMAHTHKPDLILSDINLPDLDGFEVLMLLKASEDTRDIPVIALSANGMPQHKNESVVNFHHYLQKPFDIFDLLAKVDSTLNSYQKPAPKPNLDNIVFLQPTG